MSGSIDCPTNNKPPAPVPKNIPVISFIDTPGAYPGVGAEERGQAEAIARSIECCMELGVPTLAIIIGEGGSGGAIALASSNKVIMLENSIYSVISPEGCSSILWRSSDYVQEAAESLKLTADDCLNLGIIDEIIEEPIGGAHRERPQAIMQTKLAIMKSLDGLMSLTSDDLKKHRREKFLKIGRNL